MFKSFGLLLYLHLCILEVLSYYLISFGVQENPRPLKTKELLLEIPLTCCLSAAPGSYDDILADAYWWLVGSTPLGFRVLGQPRGLALRVRV